MTTLNRSNLFAVDGLCRSDHAINTCVHDRHHAAFNVRRRLDELLHLADSLLIHVLQLLYHTQVNLLTHLVALQTDLLTHY